MERFALSVFKADVGGYLGHTGIHKNVLKRAKESLGKSKPRGLLMGKTAFPPLLGRLKSPFVKVEPEERPSRSRAGRCRSNSESDD